MNAAISDMVHGFPVGAFASLIVDGVVQVH